MRKSSVFAVGKNVSASTINSSFGRSQSSNEGDKKPFQTMPEENMLEEEKMNRRLQDAGIYKSSHSHEVRKKLDALLNIVTKKNAIIVTEKVSIEYSSALQSRPDLDLSLSEIKKNIGNKQLKTTLQGTLEEEEMNCRLKDAGFDHHNYSYEVRKQLDALLNIVAKKNADIEQLTKEKAELFIKARKLPYTYPDRRLPYTPERPSVEKVYLLREPLKRTFYTDTVLPINKNSVERITQKIQPMGSVKQFCGELGSFLSRKFIGKHPGTKLNMVDENRRTTFYSAYEEPGSKAFYFMSFLLGSLGSRHIVGVVVGDSFFIMATKRVYSIYYRSNPLTPISIERLSSRYPQVMKKIHLPPYLPLQQVLTMLELRQILRCPSKFADELETIAKAFGFNGSDTRVIQPRSSRPDLDLSLSKVEKNIGNKQLKITLRETLGEEEMNRRLKDAGIDHHNYSDEERKQLDAMLNIVATKNASIKQLKKGKEELIKKTSQRPYAYDRSSAFPEGCNLGLPWECPFEKVFFLREPLKRTSYTDTVLPINKNSVERITQKIQPMGSVKQFFGELGSPEYPFQEARRFAGHKVVDEEFRTPCYSAYEEPGNNAFYFTSFLLGSLGSRHVVGVVVANSFFIMATNRVYSRYNPSVPLIPISEERLSSIYLPTFLPLEQVLTMLELRQILHYPFMFAEELEAIVKAFGFDGSDTSVLQSHLPLPNEFWRPPLPAVSVLPDNAATMMGTRKRKRCIERLEGYSGMWKVYEL